MLYDPHSLVNSTAQTSLSATLSIHNKVNIVSGLYMYHLHNYRSADKSLARPTSRFILFDGENISFDVSLVIYINSTNIPPIMIINRIYETQNLVAVACFLPGRDKDLSAPLYVTNPKQLTS